MNNSTLLIVSAGLNLGLLGALAFYTRTPAAPVPVVVTRPAGAAKLPAPERSRPERVAAAAPGQFDWQMVESADYKKYIANLRSIGCPEETIRDVIIADVNKFYLQKLDGLVARARDFRFWQPGGSRSRINLENRQQLQVIDQEKWALLRSLLGADVEPEYRKATFPAEYLNDELTLGFLPEARRGPVREVVDRFAALEREAQNRTTGPMSAKDRAEVRKIREQRQAELAKLLTPQELEEYDLRNSTTAETLRARLAGLPSTEEQFRQLFRSQKAYDDEFGAGFSIASGGDLEKRNVALKQLESQLKGALGDQAYTEFKRAQDPAYRAVAEVARDYNLPADTAGKVYDIKKAVDDQVRALLADNTVPKGERMTALKAIGDETEKALVQTLGQAGYEAYKQNGGNWVPSVNGGVFTYTSTGPDNMTVQSYKVSEAVTGTPTEGARVKIKTSP